MEDTNKLFVFDRKEVVLIFVFIFLIAITSFTLGVRIGKQLSLKHDEFTDGDVQTTELKSSEEEYVDKVTSPTGVDDFEGSLKSKENSPTSVENLEGEIAKLTKEEANSSKKAETTLNNDVGQMPTDMTTTKNAYSGKYTIQLGSFATQEEAQNFADGFTANGYDAVIHEVVIQGKGSWFRVGIGLFNTMDDAKAYLVKEQNFFRSKDYLIKEIK